jgi:hypothetical protein
MMMTDNKKFPDRKPHRNYIDCYSVHRKLNPLNQQTIQNQGEIDMKGLKNTMKQFVGTGEKLFIGASVAVGMSAAIAAPAMAGGISNPTITGNDYYLYDVNGTQIYLNPNADLADILQGDSNSPGGNLELFASSETQAGLASFAAGATTSVSGIVGGQTLTLSSLNASDWATVQNNGKTLATNWFTEFWNNGATNDVKTNGISITKTINFFGQQQTINVNLNAQETFAYAFDTFSSIGGFAAASDPNISYAYEDGNDIKIGLAGHNDLKAFYTQDSQYSWLAEYLVDGFQASELVKYSYGGNTDYLYSFNATESGLLETDGWSHNGNYEVTIPSQSKDVPEPITGLIAAAGLGGAALRRMKKSKKS